jgi:hypothetical protein
MINNIDKATEINHWFTEAIYVARVSIQVKNLDLYVSQIVFLHERGFTFV